MSLIKFCLCIVAFAAILEGRAQAASEFCGATADRIVPIHDLHPAAGLGTDTQFSYALTAEGPRTVSGVVEIYADGSVYEVPFTDRPIVAQKEAWLDASGNHVVDYTTYRSAPQYFSFTSAHAVQAVWVESAGANGGPSHDCPTMPVAKDPQHKNQRSQVTVAGMLSDENIREKAPASPPPARLKGLLDAGNCTTVFTEAAATALVPPNYPDSLRGTTFGSRMVIVKLALASDGKVADAWVFGSSGLSEVDANALRSARASTYAPARFLCIPVPGTYLFRANFAS